jgi:hypothetical protein
MRWLKTLRAELTMPAYFCGGNYKLDTEYYNAARTPGSLYQSWDTDSAHFVVLDCIQSTPPAAHLPHKWFGAIGDAQFGWLCRDLSTVSADTSLVVVTHMPLRSSLPLRHGITQDATYPYLTVRDAERVLRALQPYRNVVCLSSHLHENERLYYGNVQLLNTGAVAGNWWHHGEESLNFDGTPQGFRVLDIADGGNFRTSYRALVPSQNRAATWFEDKAGTRFLNVFDGSRRTRVLFNGVELSFVDPTTAPGRKHPAHLWKLPPSLAQSRENEVVIVFEDGRTVREVLSLSCGTE